MQLKVTDALRQHNGQTYQEDDLIDSSRGTRLPSDDGSERLIPKFPIGKNQCYTKSRRPDLTFDLENDNSASSGSRSQRDLGIWTQ